MPPEDGRPGTAGSSKSQKRGRPAEEQDNRIILYPQKDQKQRPVPIMGAIWLYLKNSKYAYTAPSVPKPYPSYWTEPACFRHFCQWVEIQVLGGKARDRYVSWRFRFKSASDMRRALGMLTWHRGAQTEFHKLLAAGAVPTTQSVLVESQGGISFVGYLMSKLCIHSQPTMAIAIQLLGKQ